nr:hypothetical protein [uncultured Acetatifactor sp.]
MDSIKDRRIRLFFRNGGRKWDKRLGGQGDVYEIGWDKYLQYAVQIHIQLLYDAQGDDTQGWLHTEDIGSNIEQDMGMDVIAQYGVFFKRKSVHFNEILIYYRKTDVKTVYKVELSPGQHDIAKHR